ncbi:hypothetical protein LX36DRAFT_664153 [Colletotrichum falcatum]|nr:hypothetical protein LX36DRAFT_664153 [Colletotrichum falcatum]
MAIPYYAYLALPPLLSSSVSVLANSISPPSSSSSSSSYSPYSSYTPRPPVPSVRSPTHTPLPLIQKLDDPIFRHERDCCLSLVFRSSR